MPSPSEFPTSDNMSHDAISKWVPWSFSHWYHFFSEAMSGEFALSALGGLWLEALNRGSRRRTKTIFAINQLPPNWHCFSEMPILEWLNNSTESAVSLYLKIPGAETTLPPLQQYPFIRPVRMSKFFGFEEPDSNVWLAESQQGFVRLIDAESSGLGPILLSIKGNRKDELLLRQLAQVIVRQSIPCTIPLEGLKHYAETQITSRSSSAEKPLLFALQMRLFRLRIATQLFLFFLAKRP